jgi:hypothetical protein
MFAGLIASLVLRTGLSSRVVKAGLAIGAALLFAGIAALAWTLWLGHHDKAVVTADRVKSNLAVTTTNAAAHEKAADERLVDDRAVATQEKEMHDAIHSVPDSAPDAARVRLGCDRLRRAGKDLSRIPACSGSPGGH